MTEKQKIAYIGILGSIAVTILGWGLNRMSTRNAFAEVAAAHQQELTRLRLRGELSRFQGIVEGICGAYCAEPKEADAVFPATRAEFLKRVTKYELLDERFPLTEWHRFSKQHVRKSALTGFGAISERKAKLQFEIRALVSSLPQEVVSQEDANSHKTAVEQLIEKFNELSVLYARYWGMIQSITEADLVLE